MELIAPVSGRTPINIQGSKTAAEIAQINQDIADGLVTHSPGTPITLSANDSSNGTVYRLLGVGRSASFSAVSATASSLAPFKKTGSFVTKQSAGAVATGLTAGYSSVEQKPLDIYPFYGMYITLINYGSAPYTLDLVKVAGSPTDLNNGAALAWLTVLFGGIQSVTVPGYTQNPNGVAANNRIPGMVRSDFIPLSAVARTDTPGDPYLLHLRAFGAGAMSVFGGPISRTNSSVPYLFNRGYKYGWTQATVDVVTAPGAVTMTGTTALGVIGHVELMTGKDHFSLAAFGDSLTACYSGTADGGQLGWCNILDYNMRSKGIIGGVANYAVGGMTQSAFLQTMKAVCTLNKPAVAFFSSFSPNSSASTQANWDAQYGATLEAVNWCKAQGIEPIVSTAMPLDGQTAPQAAFRIAFNARLMTDLAKVCRVWDFATVIADPADPTKMLPAYNYDSIHQSPAGQEAIAAYVSLQLGL